MAVPGLAKFIQSGEDLRRKDSPKVCAGAGGWEDADRLRQGPALRSQPGVAWTEISFAGLPRPRRLVVDAPLAPSYYAAPANV